MDNFPKSHVKISADQAISKSEMLSLLQTYNCFHEGKGFQLRSWEEGEELVMEGLLNISWGLRRPIRLQMQDDNERFHYPRENITQTRHIHLESNNNLLEQHLSICSDPSSAEEEVPQLMRTQSDASIMSSHLRCKVHSSGQMQRMRRHRFSINGHFYNHKTSVFTPAYGSVTNVRVSSCMTTSQVLHLLLYKFRVENEQNEFALYVVHQSGERKRLKDADYPLMCRVLHGPCEKIAKLFLMEADLGVEVTYHVAQYINFEMPVLNSFVVKLKEEEEREISKVTQKYSVLKCVILQQLENISVTPQRL